MEKVKYVVRRVECGEEDEVVELQLVQREGEEEPRGISPWGTMYLNYILDWKREAYDGWRSQGGVDGGLGEYLQNLNERAHEWEERISADMARANGVDEALKERDPMAWVGLMNNCRACAREIIYHDLIYV